MQAPFKEVSLAKIVFTLKNLFPLLLPSHNIHHINHLCSVFKVHLVEINFVHSVSCLCFASVENCISLRCFSSPNFNRFAGLKFGSKLLKAR